MEKNSTDECKIRTLNWYAHTLVRCNTVACKVSSAPKELRKPLNINFAPLIQPLPPWEQNQNKWPPFRVGVTVCGGDYEERPQFTNYCSCRTQTLSANIFSWKKNQQHHVKMCKFGICMEYGRFVPFHTSNLPFHTWAVRYPIPISSFHTISYHSMPWTQPLNAPMATGLA